MFYQTGDVSNAGIIVGVAVGVFAVITIIVIAVIIYKCKRRDTRYEKPLPRRESLESGVYAEIDDDLIGQCDTRQTCGAVEDIYLHPRQPLAKPNQYLNAPGDTLLTVADDILLTVPSDTLLTAEDILLTQNDETDKQRILDEEDTYLQPNTIESDRR